MFGTATACRHVEATESEFVFAFEADDGKTPPEFRPDPGIESVVVSSALRSNTSEDNVRGYS